MSFDLAARLARYRRFYADPRPGQALILLSHGGGEPGEPVNLLDYDFSQMAEHRRYWDTLLRNLWVSVRNHVGLEDDWVPSAGVYYGFGAFGTVFSDAELTFTETTSYIAPFLEDWADLPRLDLGRERFWGRVFVEAAAYLSDKTEGQFLVDVFPNPSPLDVANLVRGNALFEDFYTHPDELHALLDACVEATLRNVRRIAAATRVRWPGTVAFNRWIPQGTLLLEDAADLCSPAVYRAFGQPYTQRVIDATGGAYIHHHSLGQQQFANIAALRGLYVEQISSDPNAPRPITQLGAILPRTGSMPLDLECDVAEVETYVNDLRKGRFILSVEAADRSEAQALLEFVRRELPIGQGGDDG